MSAVDKARALSARLAIAAAGSSLGAALTEQTEKARSRRQAGLTLLLRVAGAGIAFLSQAFIARWLGASEFGFYAIAWTYVVICGSLSQAGFAASVIRFVAQYREFGLHARMRGLHRFAFATVLGIGVAVAVLGSLVLSVQGPRLDPGLMVPLQLALLCIPIFALTELGRGVARAHDWMMIAYAPAFLGRPVALTLILAALIGAGYSLSAELAMWASIGGAAVALAAQWLAIERRLRPGLLQAAARYRPRTWIVVSVPLLVVDGFYVMMSHLDVVMLAAFVSSAEVAVYFAAVKVTALLSFISFAVSAVAAPMLARLHAARRREDLEAAVHMFIGWTFWPTLAGSLLLALAGDWILGLFGRDFTEGYDLMLILCVALLAQAAVGPIKFLLSMTGQQNAMAGLLCAAAAINIGLNLALIPAMGPKGAAIGTAAATLIGSVLLLMLVRKRLGVWSIIGGRQSRPQGAS